jgi:hypothetical protein
MKNNITSLKECEYKIHQLLVSLNNYQVSQSSFSDLSTILVYLHIELLGWTTIVDNTLYMLYQKRTYAIHKSCHHNTKFIMRPFKNVLHSFDLINKQYFNIPAINTLIDKCIVEYEEIEKLLITKKSENIIAIINKLISFPYQCDEILRIFIRVILEFAEQG